METPQIALLIAGNNQSNGGYSVIYSLNNPPFSLPALSYGGRLDANSYYFTVCATETYTLFTLVQNHVKSHGAVRAGFLKMGISIPRGYRLTVGTSPYDLLLAVRRQFLETCMDEVLGEADTYTYKAEMAPAESFAELLSHFSLEPDPSPQPAMTGTDAALLILPETEMRSALDEVHRTDYADYCELVLAASGVPVSASANLPATVAFASADDVTTTSSEANPSETELSASEAGHSVSKSDTKEKQPETKEKNRRRLAELLVAGVVGLIIGFAISTLIYKLSGDNRKDDSEKTEKAEKTVEKDAPSAPDSVASPNKSKDAAKRAEDAVKRAEDAAEKAENAEERNEETMEKLEDAAEEAEEAAEKAAKRSVGAKPSKARISLFPR